MKHLLEGSRRKKNILGAHPNEGYRLSLVFHPRRKTAGVRGAGSRNFVGPLDRASGERHYRPTGRETRGLPANSVYPVQPRVLSGRALASLCLQRVGSLPGVCPGVALH